MPTLVVAALSARWLCEAAVDAGYRVVALDVFGDVDTRRIAAGWQPIGRPGTLRIDPARVLAGLREARLDGRVTGWLAGSGIEGLPDVLERGAALLPLLGTAPQDVRRVRDPLSFFAALREHGIAYPPTRFLPPPQLHGWLIKDARGTGGSHIRPAEHYDDAQPLGPSEYFQQLVDGTPMSATFIGNGEDAAILGFNALIAQRHRYAGVIGPVPLAAEPARVVAQAVRGLTARFRLCGLGSLDFLLSGDRVAVLEVNPRPPASLALYRALQPLQAHMRALAGELPVLPADRGRPRGTQVYFAPARGEIDAAASQALAAMTDCHDVPSPGTRFDPGDPVCSVSAEGDDVDAVREALALRLAEVAPRLVRFEERI